MIIRGSNFHFCIIRWQYLGPKIIYVENTELKVISRSLEVISMSFKFFKCFVRLQAIWWPDFIKFRSGTPEIQGHLTIWAHLAP